MTFRVSVAAAIMSFAFSFTGFGLGFTKVICRCLYMNKSVKIQCSMKEISGMTLFFVESEFLPLQIPFTLTPLTSGSYIWSCLEGNSEKEA